MPTLFDPVRLGAITATNRVFMAPLTRARASREHVPTALMIDYYRQRASAGLIISEAIGVSRQGLGMPFAPGLWSQEQVEGWKPITAAVHAAGGWIVAQLWHMGRLVHSSVTGEAPVASSAVVAPGHAHSYAGNRDYEVPRALKLEEIPGVVTSYVAAARNAMEAGFDGVQIHAANGYLIDSFLRDGVNQRKDGYGGTPENRARLLREVTQAVADAIGADHTSVRLSLNGVTQGTDDSDPGSIALAAAQALEPIGLAFLELRELKPSGTYGASDAPRQSPFVRQHFSGPIVLNSDYDLASAQADIDSGLAQAISFGRPFIANPDLPRRLATGAALNSPEQATFYLGGAEGYTDYPALEEAA